MNTIQPGDQVVSMGPDRESIEVHTVVSVLPGGLQVDGTSGKISKTELRAYKESIVNQIREKESELKSIKQDIRSLYESLGRVE
ncbi:hypothetical protein [Desulfomonile tiedjei]|uniref:Uncharacterized protein n=1 Tax=Desulfomonile tiedjei (strain ATCC 49306 / DSM 6799 / DCB-1) TaxID=706587 RepID=I4C415_DESTA|nr:hypothetical protein [Desulfomonile tiedjei]AFM24306.1 hypothetical protein Desti_1595 [Desulfomonile tiedjei DSM 6799]